MTPIVSMLSLAGFVLALLIIKGVRNVNQYEKGLVERFGKYRRTLDSGLHVIIPFIEVLRRVDMREQVIDVPPQEVITKDNVAVTVDAVIYLEVVDPFNYEYNVTNYYLAITKLAQTNLRNLIGDMSLDESLISRDTINTRLRQVLDTVTDKWGTRVGRVEIQRIEPPADVTDAMHKQMKAERYRRAAILEAEATKTSAILVAEGEKESRITRAQGEAEATKTVAEAEKYRLLTVADGEALAVQKVYGAIKESNPTPELLAIKYLESLKDISDGQATKIFLPFEGSGMLGSLAGIRELFAKDETGK